MSRRRRQVRVAPSFFERLDELLPEQRSPAGDPSATDFLLHELPPLIDALAEDYESTTVPVGGAASVRVMIGAGVFLAYVAIYTVLADDDAVEIIYLEVDRG